ncbi:hypothetical protein HAZT_HAZT005527 [Hyalella azteca]|uniref:Bicarbonate transporter-like transmembrane domain-containing protein n=1 Tax=Hyalella azteca TaxID=294128 RepID=A0A6A0HCC7_HYAAZ|nr:hypothetical protein HAZT_HAZT005527 [Hyalella azteca]
MSVMPEDEEGETEGITIKVRTFISDFAVIIAILLMVGLDMLIGIHTPKLEVPSKFEPTWEGRGWLIMPFNGNPWWTGLVAVLPALLACILIFMDQQITAVIINRREFKLKVLILFRQLDSYPSGNINFIFYSPSHLFILSKPPHLIRSNF